MLNTWKIHYMSETSVFLLQKDLLFPINPIDLGLGEPWRGHGSLWSGFLANAASRWMGWNHLWGHRNPPQIGLFNVFGWWFQTFFMFHNIWDNPSHWLIFFKMVKTTNQYTYESVWMGSIPWYLMVVCCTPILQQLHLKWWWILEQTEKFHCPDHQLWVFILCITQLNCFGWKVPRFNNGS
jgi:hypothetical protein